MHPGLSNEEQNTIELRQKLVDYLKSQGNIRSSQVEAAFRATPRHIFVPGTDIEQVYSDTYILTKQQDGVPVSSSSQPAVMAIMLEMLAIQPGQRILEIGAGTGYNAALLAHIVGNTGSVVTIDIDEDIVAAAREHLDAAGFTQVQAICGDGGFGYPDAAPYDRVIVTASTSDILPAWREQLKAGGRLVLPFRITSLTTQHWLFADQTLLAFEHAGDHLLCTDMYMGGFLPLRGAFAQQAENRIQLAPDGSLTIVTFGSVNSDSVSALLKGPYQDEVLNIRVTHLELLGLRLWLAWRDNSYCELYGQGDAIGHDRIPTLVQTPGLTIRTMGLYEESAASLLIHQPEHDTVKEEGDQTFALTIRTFGTQQTLVQRLVEHLAVWERAGRPFRWNPQGLTHGLQIRIYPADTAYTPTSNEFVVDRPGSRMVFQW
jgi:protein-L-isoaspartate(D-aspartate) O-methyltransferase